MLLGSAKEKYWPARYPPSPGTGAPRSAASVSTWKARQTSARIKRAAEVTSGANRAQVRPGRRSTSCRHSSALVVISAVGTTHPRGLVLPAAKGEYMCYVLVRSSSKKLCAPRSVVFSPRLARARVSLSCESACRAHAGAVCVQKFFSRVRRRSVSYAGVTCVGEQAGMSNARALGQSAQAEQDTSILLSCQGA